MGEESGVLFCSGRRNEMIPIAMQDEGGLNDVAHQLPQRALVGMVKITRRIRVQRKAVHQPHMRCEFLGGPQSGQLKAMQGVVQVIVSQKFEFLDTDG